MGESSRTKSRLNKCLVAVLQQVFLAFRARHVGRMIQIRPRACRTVRATAERTSARSAVRPARYRPNRPPTPESRRLARAETPHSAAEAQSRSKSFVLSNVEHLHMVGDQLAAVFVAGDQETLPAEFVRFGRATVANTSSASYDSHDSEGIPNAAITRWMAGNCGRQDPPCISARWILY